MNNHLRKFLLNNSIALLLLALAGALLFSTLFISYYHFSYPLVLILSFGVNVLIYFLFTRKDFPANKTTILITQSFAIKFFYYLLVAALFLILVENQPLRIAFICILFVLYLVFTFLEISALLRFFKSKVNNS